MANSARKRSGINRGLTQKRPQNLTVIVINNYYYNSGAKETEKKIQNIPQRVGHLFYQFFDFSINSLNSNIAWETMKMWSYIIMQLLSRIGLF